MKKKTIEDLRKDYQIVTGIVPAIRWNRQTLEKKITDAEILAAGYAAKNGAMKKQVEPGEPNPEFEKLASEQVEITGTERNDGVYKIDEVVTETAGRGGYREGAGRPTGQTDERARVERLMALEVPDLAVGIGVDALNTGLARLTGVGIDDKAVASEALANMPHGSQSLALGLTRLLYYWCPSLQGRTDVVTLNLEALFLIINPFRERAERVNQLIKQKEKEHVEQKTEDPQRPVGESQQAPAPAAEGRFTVKPLVKKPPVKARRKR